MAQEIIPFDAAAAELGIAATGLHSRWKQGKIEQATLADGRRGITRTDLDRLAAERANKPAKVRKARKARKAVATAPKATATQNTGHADAFAAVQAWVRKHGASVTVTPDGVMLNL